MKEVAQVPASSPMLGAVQMYRNSLLSQRLHLQSIQVNLGHLDSISALHSKVQLNPQEAMDFEGTA